MRNFVKSRYVTEKIVPFWKKKRYHYVIPCPSHTTVVYEVKQSQNGDFLCTLYIKGMCLREFRKLASCFLYQQIKIIRKKAIFQLCKTNFRNNEQPSAILLSECQRLESLHRDDKTKLFRKMLISYFENSQRKRSKDFLIFHSDSKMVHRLFIALKRLSMIHRIRFYCSTHNLYYSRSSYIHTYPKRKKVHSLIHFTLSHKSVCTSNLTFLQTNVDISR